MKTLAIFCADLHLSLKPPSARSAELDWLASQKRHLDQLGDLNKGEIPIVIAGDLLDRWNNSSEFVNFVIDYLPNCLSLVGQHDLPNHRYDDLDRSSYGTLIRSGKIQNLSPNGIVSMGGFVLYSFPWGSDIKPIESKEDGKQHIAVIHKFIYKGKSTSYPGAPKDEQIRAYADCLKGYDAATFGDNHIPFTGKAGDCRVLNCGSLIPRNIKEREHKPRVLMLMEDGSWESQDLDTSADKWIDATEAERLEHQELDMSKLLSELDRLGTEEMDYRVAVERYIGDKVNKVCKSIAKRVLEVLDDAID
ncbi:hypothetical protein LCGC14_0248660 [marine sediment metagenome]|uniref:Calcineurin-like phosphoesterase domain-containing protein n=1 Tax=marine sediment metagenome TaxID=412755 RepID=A0A0F9U9N4_9ZZZZ